ncbi:MAG: siderophore biosynthesis protein [Cyanobacteria bacterium P01_A01_bin.83]
MENINPHIIWEGFHWSFFVSIQGLVISMLRFEKFVAADDIEAASRELTSASSLMRAGAASMELAGSFTREEYDRYIRPSMMPPKVNVDDFSGLMFWDHTYLMIVWKRVQPNFKNLSSRLKAEHDDFVAAYMSLSESHKNVCAKFGGTEIGSLRSKNTSAVETLAKFEQNRKKLISNS